MGFGACGLWPDGAIELSCRSSGCRSRVRVTQKRPSGSRRRVSWDCATRFSHGAPALALGRLPATPGSTAAPSRVPPCPLPGTPAPTRARPARSTCRPSIPPSTCRNANSCCSRRPPSISGSRHGGSASRARRSPRSRAMRRCGPPRRRPSRSPPAIPAMSWAGRPRSIDRGIRGQRFRVRGLSHLCALSFQLGAGLFAPQLQPSVDVRVEVDLLQLSIRISGTTRA